MPISPELQQKLDSFLQENKRVQTSTLKKPQEVSFAQKPILSQQFTPQEGESILQRNERLKAQGISPIAQGEQQAIQKGMISPEAPKPTFIESVAQATAPRVERIKESQARFEGGEQGYKETAFQQSAAVLGAAGDAFFEALKVGIDKLPEQFKKDAKNVSQQIIESPEGQVAIKALSQGLESWNKFEQENPRIANNIKSVVDVGFFLSQAPILSKTGEVVETGIKKGAEVGLEGAKMTGETIAKGGEQLVKSAETGFKEQAKKIATKGLEELSQSQRQGVAKRVSESRFGTRSIIPDNREQASIDEVARMIQEGKISASDSSVKQVNKLDNEISSMANQLEKDLKKNPSSTINQKQAINLLEDIKSELDKNVFIQGESKASVDRLFENAKNEINGLKEINSLDLLRIRKGIDQTVKSQKGTGLFDPKTENAISTALRELRQTLNDQAAQLAPTVELKNSLARQSALFDALSAAENRFAKESGNWFSRIIQKIPIVNQLPRSEIIEAATAVGLAGAASAVVPTLGSILATGWILKKTGEFVLSPKHRMFLGKILQKAKPVTPEEKQAFNELSKLSKGATYKAPKEVKQLDKTKFLKETPKSDIVPLGKAGTAKKSTPEEFKKLVDQAQTPDRSIKPRTVEELSTLDTRTIRNNQGGFALNSPDKSGTIELTNVFSLKKGEGIGREVMETAIEEARKKGAKKIVLDAYKRLEPFYKKFNFKKTAEYDFDPKYSSDSFDPRVKGEEWKHRIIEMELNL